MTRKLPVALTALGFLTVVAPIVLALGGDNSISFGAGEPASPQTGKIQANGSYSIASGFVLDFIDLKCAPTGGGSQQSSQANSQNGAWSAVINPVAAGTYNVWAEMTYHPNGQARRVIQTSIVQVTVN